MYNERKLTKISVNSYCFSGDTNFLVYQQKTQIIPERVEQGQEGMLVMKTLHCSLELLGPLILGRVPVLLVLYLPNHLHPNRQPQDLFHTKAPLKLNKLNNPIDGVVFSPIPRYVIMQLRFPPCIPPED